MSKKRKKRKNKISNSYHTLSLKIEAGLNNDQTGLVSAVFEDYALSFSCKKDNGAWDFLWTFDHKPDEEELQRRFAIIADLAAIPEQNFKNHTLEELDENRDWLAESYRALPPFTVGPFFI